MPPIPVRAAVFTVSSSRSERTDESGKIVREVLEKEGIPTAIARIVPDIVEEIGRALDEGLEAADCIVFCGGTGLTPDDCTIEAVGPRLEKRIDGFGELFRWLSYQEVGSAALLSRAVAGIAKQRAVFCIPGSPHAARLASEKLIAPEIRHILSHARRQQAITGTHPAAPPSPPRGL